MGNSASRVARRQYPAKCPLSRDDKLPVEIVKSAKFEGKVTTGSNKSDYMDSESDDQKDLEYGSILEKLGGAIIGRTLPVQQAGRESSHTFRPAEPSGRLRLPAVRALLHEHAVLNQHGPVSTEAIEQLARRYAVDPEILRLVLKYHTLPNMSDNTTA
ncbi:g10368 [Coccomyxa elongata]